MSEGRNGADAVTASDRVLEIAATLPVERQMKLLLIAERWLRMRRRHAVDGAQTVLQNQETGVSRQASYCPKPEPSEK